MFSAKMNGETVWVIDDGTVYTLLYPATARKGEEP